MRNRIPTLLFAAAAGLAGCGGGDIVIDPCAGFRSREQIPERHCPPEDRPTATAGARITHPDTTKPRRTPRAS